MTENTQNGHGFVGYEYKAVTAAPAMADVYADCYPCFGWVLEDNVKAIDISAKMKFKRSRKIINKAELTRLQRQFESQVNTINKLEQSKTTIASIAAATIGVIGTALMAGSVFAVTSSMVVLCIILAVPGFIGWILPYFCYQRMVAKKTVQVAPLIEEQYDAIYATCEKARTLLYK